MDDFQGLLKALMGHFSPQLTAYDQTNPEQLLASLFGQFGAPGGYAQGFEGSNVGQFAQPPEKLDQMNPTIGGQEMSGPINLLHLLGLHQ